MLNLYSSDRLLVMNSGLKNGRYIIVGYDKQWVQIRRVFYTSLRGFVPFFHDICAIFIK